MNTKFTLNETAYEEAICFPNGHRAFFLAHSGHGMHSDTVRLAKIVVELLNQLPVKQQLEICPYHLNVDVRKLDKN